MVMTREGLRHVSVHDCMDERISDYAGPQDRVREQSFKNSFDVNKPDVLFRWGET